MTSQNLIPLPAIGPNDLDNSRTADPRWWQCRYCLGVETGQLTNEAKTRRRAAHECRCPSRPAQDEPTFAERLAYQVVYAEGLRDDHRSVEQHLLTLRDRLRRTHFWNHRKRSQIKREIDLTDGSLIGIWVYSLYLGLEPGWINQDFKPNCLPHT